VSPARPRAILFDYGMTLVDSSSFPRAELLATIEAARPRIEAATGRATPPAQALMTAVLEPLEAALATLDNREVDWLEISAQAWRGAGFDLPASLIYELVDREQRCWEGAVKVTPATLEVLDQLRARGLRLVLVSNAPFPPEMMVRQLAGNGVGARLHGAIFSSAVGWRKPASQIYEAALEVAGCEAGQALFVGDSEPADYWGPRAVGMDSLLYTGLGGRPSSPEVEVLPDLGGLLERF
jgi:HAD superfamily hydrolase (TIGR01549 family)